MKKITMIVMPGCPYCANARRAVRELKEEEPAYSGLVIETIDEVNEADKAKPYGNDYYYVPALFMEGKKYYEAHPGESYEECKNAVSRVFAAAVK